MPIYQYQCAKCKTQFDLRQSFSDKAVTICPSCKGVAHRCILPVPVLFKGPGFYITDSRIGTEGHKPVEGAKDQAKKPQGES